MKEKFLKSLELLQKGTNIEFNDGLECKLSGVLMHETLVLGSKYVN